MRFDRYFFVAALCFSCFYNAQTQDFQSDTVAFENCADFEVYKDSTVSSEVLKERFNALQNVFPMRYNAISHQYVDIFTFRKAPFVKRMLEQIPSYFPLYEQMLAKYDLPDELKYLSLIESGLNPRIISYASAGGLWQFMPATGREYGMYQDGYVDERFDPVKATEGACRYLKQLYKSFGDWELALAAYNTGPGNVRKALKRSGTNSFWGCYEYLPKQTRMYVPQFVAMIYMINYHADHGIFGETPNYAILSDTLHVSGYFNLHQFAEASDVSVDDLYKLNPHLISTEMSPMLRNYPIRVPSDRHEYIVDNRVAIWNVATTRPIDPSVMLAAELKDSDSTTHIVAQNISNEPSKMVLIDAYEDKTIQTLAAKPTVKYHFVQRGDTLWTIAQRYGIPAERLKKLNRLRSNAVKKGQKLIVS
jgi:membrane-bound lytic murein transglycosylase D